MNELTAAGRYTGVSKTLHWLIALLAFSQLAMGKFFEVEADEPGSLFGWHTALRAAGPRTDGRARRLATDPRRARPAPGDAGLAAARGQSHAHRVLRAADCPARLRLAARLVDGDAVSFFGWFTVPPLPVPGGEASEDLIEEAHELLGNVLLVLAGIHVLAGLKHHYIDRDDVLRRMMPGSG